ncbi:L,D-transpeptidase family protein [Cohnella yongneupensis]|uniref:L,D-transpeptidase family protein n=1 Tax=Cohnella yongneupensis TaxID=425006 RepID=A0ABW0QY05_9BACL
MNKLHFCKRIALIVILLFTLTSVPFAHANPSLPIVSNQGIYAIEIYPLNHKLVLYMLGKPLKTYPVAVGNPSTPTPVGDYLVTYKGRNWGPSYGPRWIGLDVPWGFYGIHGTNRPDSIGKHQSHGCIRMRNRDVIELFDIVPVGTRVTIVGHVLGSPNENPRVLAENDVGGDVQLIQSRLKSAGYFNGACDGKFRSDTTAALKHFQRDHQLEPDGVADIEVYENLGLIE